MSVADLHDLELIWPSLGPTDVIVTGTFDQWSSSIHLVKGDAGFVTTVQVPWGQKIAYKFIVDGRWECRNDRPQEEDGHGNVNNVFETPEKPEPVAAAPARLAIPPDGEPLENYGDVDNMVTAIEFLPPAEPAEVRGPLLLPVPPITIRGIDQAVPTPVTESKLNTAAATEGHEHDFPASVTVSADPAQAPSSQHIDVLPLNDNGPVSSPPIDGNGEASNGFATHAPIQFMKGDLHTSPLSPETAEDVVAIPSESAVPQSSSSPQTVQVDAPPVAKQEPTAKQPDVAPGTDAVTSNRASTSSAPSSGTSTQKKKRRSLFARIKHMFDKNKEKENEEKREKNKP